MAKGGFSRGGMGSMGGGNMNAMLKQAQKMQQEMLKKQEELNEREFEATAGGGAVKVTVFGRKELKNIEISPAAVDPDDVEMLQDLILAATNEALRLADETVSNEMSQLTGGLNMGF